MDSDLGNVPSSGKATSQALAHHLRTEIEAGRLTHRAPLPTSKELAKQYDTSPATVSRAMDILAAEGLIIGKPRAGRIVNYPPPAERSAPSRPTVLLIGGYAGSGKTELGRILARRTHWPMLDKDTTTRPVVEQALELLGEVGADVFQGGILQAGAGLAIAAGLRGRCLRPAALEPGPSRHAPKRIAAGGAAFEHLRQESPEGNHRTKDALTTIDPTGIRSQ